MGYIRQTTIQYERRASSSVVAKGGVFSGLATVSTLQASMRFSPMLVKQTSDEVWFLQVIAN